MQFRKFLAVVLIPIVLGAVMTPAALNAEPKIKLTRIYENLETERPISWVTPPDGSKRRFLVEQTGKIKILPADEKGAEAKVFADFTGVMAVEKDFEEGLLGLAFHPKYAENGKFYVYFSRQGPKRSVVSEFQVSKADPDQADLSTERVLLEIQQPEWNHNSGNMQFGPKDGFLYISVGDGGFRDGIHFLAQRLQAWNGKVLRIDVDSRSDGREYGIPADNPFIGDPNAAPEIWAYGLRNPWGSWIDPETNQFWLADVGQDLWEEVNLIERGGNYGWNFREGLHEFTTRAQLMTLLKKKDEVARGLIDPIHEYNRNDGLSITGGLVYRGDSVPGLKDHYIFGDWKLGNLWALKYDAEAKKVTAHHAIHKPADPKTPTVQPAAFAADENGEVIVLGWDGKLFRIEGE